MGILWEHSFTVFFLLTVVLGGAAAAATGRALARQWRPYRHVIFYMLLLGCADRFLHWGLFLDYPLDVYKGELFSLHYYLVDTAVLIVFASVAYQITRTWQMTHQYRWLYRRTSPFTWEKREATER